MIRRAMRGLLAFCLFLASAPAPAQGGAAPRPLDCLIEPSLEVKLGSAADGVIASIAVERGAVVRRGQALVHLNSQLEAAAVASARGKAEFARRKAERNDELYKQQLISVQERDQLETEARLADLELREREAALRLRTIVSPIDGVVIHADQVVGKIVDPTEHLFEVVDLSTVWVKIGVLERDLHHVAIGQPVELTLAAYPGEVFRDQVQVKGKTGGKALRLPSSPIRALRIATGSAWPVNTRLTGSWAVTRLSLT